MGDRRDIGGEEKEKQFTYGHTNPPASQIQTQISVWLDNETIFRIEIRFIVGLYDV